MPMGLNDSPAYSSGGSLDTAPPMPPQPSRKDMMTLNWSQPPSGGMGPEAADPQVKALQGMQMIQMGVQLISVALPVLAAPLQALIGQLENVVPQAMADSVAGTPPSGMMAPSPVPAAPNPSQGQPGAAGPAGPMM